MTDELSLNDTFKADLMTESFRLFCLNISFIHKKTTSNKVVFSFKKYYFLNGNAYFTIRLITLPYCFTRLALL